MADELDYEIYQERKPLPRRRRRRTGRVLLILVVLMVIAAGSAFGWLSYGRLVEPASFAASPVSAAVPRNTEATVSLSDFQSFQQQTSQSLQSMDQGIAAQKAEIARLSDQLSALATKIEALQTATAPTSAPVAQAQPAVAAPHKRLPVTRPTRSAAPAGPISVGGAPLPAPSVEGQ